MKYSNPNANFPTPYDDGYGSRQVWMLLIRNFTLLNCRTKTMFYEKFLSIWIEHFFSGCCGQGFFVWFEFWFMGPWETKGDSSLRCGRVCSNRNICCSIELRARECNSVRNILCSLMLMFLIVFKYLYIRASVLTCGIYCVPLLWTKIMSVFTMFFLPYHHSSCVSTSEGSLLDSSL